MFNLKGGGGIPPPPFFFIVFNMKTKKIILLLVISIFGLSEAQQLVKQFTFDTPADVQGWSFYDGNGNGNQWVQGQNIIQNGTQLTYGTAGVLRHSKELVPTGFAPGFETEDDWVISPEIDLTNASGTITFAGYIGRQRTNIPRAGRQIFIYESTPAKPVPDLSDFQALTAAFNMNAGTTAFPWDPTNVEVFIEVTRDMSAYAGKKVYIGMKTDSDSGGNAPNYQNINIDEISIYADEYTMATSDAKGKTAVIIYPNPATDVLYLKGVSKANAAVYSTAGQLVSKQAVTNGQLNVSALPKGVYTLSVEADGKVSTTKFIKK